MSFFATLFGAKAQETDAIKILDKETFKKAIEADSIQLVDVRTPQEYEAGHINNARNIDYFDQGNFTNSFEKLDKEKPVYVYCRSGNRSQKAAALLEAMGFREIYDLRGGYLGW
ncbi:MAG TPA: rhodanese-like domain-containing protein [Flavobacteriaceae bacterium]|nr:rhodanese-like domain-containing protein [Flavobacteriaceae bacterium]MCB9211879.1 rhodanese-like domain-containing protein [Alteromonas sp.]HPF10027.1 rhodanese-like domain-containing protein [Flavobacteriaceae bacterium]HRW44376.1 rhodanese-like domain-containing protein [Flavobacteriaceae bacterium]